MRPRRFPTDVGTRFGVAVVVLLIVLTVAGEWLSPVGASTQDLTASYLPPFWMSGADPAHLLGTDQLGRDVLSRVIAGTQVSVIVGIGSVALQLLVGVTLGVASGYFGGWADAIIMRIADVVLSIPFLVLALAIAAILGPGVQNTIFVLAAVGWVTFARIVRAETLALREREFVLAAKASGRGAFAIMRDDVLPNVAGSVIVVATLQLSQMIIAESSLSFLGLGVQPPGIAWGSMIAEGLGSLMVAWWVVLMPGLALMVTTIGVNLLGDGLREALDPKGRTE